ncbi:hypothetical protein NEFER03_0133 [Nematocida sp. LUAm3]|nr:hypothetical protein NEFER03_0133 [Nematocida sp. LUAm3]KAI5173586.1 hypothetical protein NEFER02_0102 [Nematocida sp. LUAm2]KAI5176807.1 hypothetical protein NEFER01_0132 [Nematocida sp. LUAm1]
MYLREEDTKKKREETSVSYNTEAATGLLDASKLSQDTSFLTNQKYPNYSSNTPPNLDLSLFNASEPIKAPHLKDPVSQYVLESFNDICKKIDVIYSVIDKNNSLDTMVIEQTQNESPNIDTKKGWLEAIRDIFTNKEEKEEKREYLEEISQDILKVKKQANNLQNILREATEELRRLSSEILFLVKQQEKTKKSEENTANQLIDLKLRLKLRKKELLEAQSLISSQSASQASLAKISSVFSSQIGRILVLLDKQENQESLKNDILQGHTHKVVGTFLDIESSLRAFLLKEEKEASHHILSLEERNNKTLHELRRKEEEALRYIKEIEHIKDQKDEIINKQRLTIKLLQSKLLHQTHMVTPPHTPNNSSRPSHSIISELEAQINRLKEKIDRTDQSDPAFRKYLHEIEDYKRRLTDFLRA